MAGNPFDQFDPPAAAAPPAGANPFDQFDTPAQAEPPGLLASINRGLTQGVTFGYADEMAGALGGAASFMRGEGFTPGYERTRDEVRVRDASAEAAHPWATTGGKLAGNVIGTVPMIAGAPVAFGAAPGMGLVARVGAGAMSGGGLGLVQGFGEGQGALSDQGMNALAGAGTGAAFGAGGTALGSAIGAAMPAVTNYARSALPGFGRAASRDLVGAYEAVGPAEVRSTLDQLGLDAMLVDAGLPFVSRAQGVAAQTGAPGQRVVSALTNRNEGANARLASDLDSALGPAMNPETVEAGFQGIRNQAGQAYGQATAQAGPVDTSSVLALLGQRLTTAEGGERAALLRARDMLVARDANGQLVPKTDARNLHSVKGELDNLISYGDPTIGVVPGTLSKRDGAVSGIRGALNQALEEQVPGYANANLSARTAHAASEALESGKRVLDSGETAIRPDSFATALDVLPLEQQAALRVGVRADLDRIVGTKANDLVALKQQVMGEGDWNRAKLVHVFGEDEAARVWNATDRESAFRDAYNRVVNGSNTAKIQEGVKATEIRSLRPGAGSADIALGGALGGGAGAATAAAAKAGRYGWNVVGRQLDRARNEDLSQGLTATGPRLAAILRDMDATIANRTTPEDARQRATMMAQVLMQSTDRASENRERAKTMARLLAELR